MLKSQLVPELTSTVIVCTRNRPSELEKCLAGVFEQTMRPSEVLVVDNASQSPGIEEIARRWGAKYIYEPRIGLSIARNRGAKESSGDVIAYLDDDAIPRNDWLVNLLDVFRDTAIVAAGGRTIAPQEDPEAHRLCSLIQGPGTMLEPIVVDRSHPEWFEITAFGGIGTGMNMAFRRLAFDQWPGFDSRLGLPDAAGEEQFAVFSLVDRGHKAAYVPGAVVSHPSTYTVEGLRSRYFAACAYATSYILFLFVHAPRHRKKLLRFLFQALTGVHRTWRSGSNAEQGKSGLSKSKIFAARCRGIWLYLRSRRLESEVSFSKSSL